MFLVERNKAKPGGGLLFPDRLMIGLVAPLWRRENHWESSGGVMFCPLILFSLLVFILAGFRGTANQNTISKEALRTR